MVGKKNTVVFLGIGLSIAAIGVWSAAGRAAVGNTIPRSTTYSAVATVVRAQFGRYSNRADYERYGGPGGGPRPPLAPETNDPLPTRKVVAPMIFPVLGSANSIRWRDGYNVSRGSYRHTAIDIDAAKMQPIVAPFAGILGFKTQTFWIFGDNRYKCLGTHLNDDTPGTNDNRADRDFMFAPNLRPGDHVVGGQLLGYVGNSGNATGPHLHFELFAPDGVLVNPFYSLKAATHIAVPRPILSESAIRPAAGEIRIDGCYRKWDPADGVLTLLLVTRQAADGRAFAYAVPTWYRLTLPPALIESTGGSEVLSALSRDRAIAFTVSAALPGKVKSRAEGTTGYAHRIVLPGRT
jgi:murein DD-endopeptidase MepM/ murein hydrolase activator NlpD